MTSELDTGIAVGIRHHHFHFQFKIAILGVGAQETIGRIGNGIPGNNTAIDFKPGLASTLGPAFQALSVKQIFPVSLGATGNTKSKNEGGQQNSFHIAGSIGIKRGLR